MKRFKKVYIEITNQCNLACEFCPLTKRQGALMTEATFEKIITEVKPLTDHVYFHVMGEPLMHPLLERFLARAADANLKVNLTTNGTLLKEKKEILLQAKTLRQINISLTSFEANAAVTDAFGNVYTLETYLSEVIDFVKVALVNTNVICSLRLWNMDTAHLKGANANNGIIFETLEKVFELPFSIEEQLNLKAGIKLKERLYLNTAEKFEWPDLQKEMFQTEVFCYGLRDQIGILTEGTVVPCCLDGEGHINLGNILETPLEQLLKSPKALAIYEGFSRRIAVEPLCQRCGYATRY